MDIKFLHFNQSVVDNFSPYPAKKSPPDWFKKLPLVVSSVDKSIATAKNCIPLQDVVNAGYIIPNTYEVDLKTKKISAEDFAIEVHKPHPANVGFHVHAQCPMHNDNGNINFFKLYLDWKIQTPPGYSCLFFDPFYREQRPYQILPAIVDTDDYDIPINFIGQLNTHNVTTIAPGEPIVQVIPFKRDEWNMTAEFIEKPKEGLLDFFNLTTSHPRRLYKTLIHKKKKFN